MRAAPIADPATDKACVIIVAVAAAVTGIVDRIASIERTAPDTQTASACGRNNQTHLRRIKRHCPRCKWIKDRQGNDRDQWCGPSEKPGRLWHASFPVSAQHDAIHKGALRIGPASNVPPGGQARLTAKLRLVRARDLNRRDFGRSARPQHKEGRRRCRPPDISQSRRQNRRRE